MNTDKLLLRIVFTFLVISYIPESYSQVHCQTPELIESINKGRLGSRMAHITGPGAMVFIALDPYWSKPEFVNIPFRHPVDMAEIKKNFAQLTEQGIDEVIVWEFASPRGLGAAVPFKSGCTVDGYGEPDHVEKLAMMVKTFRHIRDYGLNDQRVKADIKQLLLFDLNRYRDNSIYDDSMIDIMINKLRPLVARMKEGDKELQNKSN